MEVVLRAKLKYMYRGYRAWTNLAVNCAISLGIDWSPRVRTERELLERQADRRQCNSGSGAGGACILVLARTRNRRGPEADSRTSQHRPDPASGSAARSTARSATADVKCR